MEIFLGIIVFFMLLYDVVPRRRCAPPRLRRAHWVLALMALYDVQGVRRRVLDSCCGPRVWGVVV